MSSTKFNTDQVLEAIHFLEYNSERKSLAIPEYGRHLHNLISQAITIENREERNKLAKYIIGVMGGMNPHLRDVPDFQHKLWDQLFIMSDFLLDVDSPYPIPTREVINMKAAPLPYPQNFPKYRFYGNNITYMIDKANEWEDGDLKNALIRVIANHMKKSYLSWNKDTVTDAVIFEHLYELSDGKINLSSTTEELSNTHDLMRTNKRTSNKMQSNNSISNNNGKHKNQKNIQQKRPFKKNN
ncbi:DUF4290 domain-containing protein [Flavobacterium columnare NBRC 100251 = ATCC 23463]|uniref:DUF4290 domain-containing protein n=2 Tax=Flavobacterium columnare TaxID=996 RepID=G8X8G3_FLACA|nr:DUF4290 domain-containing protein [Flavobacterium columnare]AEW85797.1 hypothetical protein FCOL_04830 [Flavobacterium columnare ATCC 49512]AMO18971.1 DUF4290 domain-containing protein [Flavobacterium columnare]ANO47880.1 hypothetical protein Pf1_02426 [Flavobacterium columnare]APT21531.1 hypothetical protein BU993_02070 [Flavobacterium columnare]AUX16888.1 hypothetical protein AQ623_00085 [Flavobacterium columnare]